jgi:hypothetical protein
LADPAPHGDDRLTMIERRTRRSQDHAEALAMFLESQSRELRSRGLAVTTRDGKLLAGVGPSPERLARAGIEIHEAREDAATTKDVATWWLRAGGTEVVLASRGGRLSHDLGTGVKRILTRG